METGTKSIRALHSVFIFIIVTTVFLLLTSDVKYVFVQPKIRFWINISDSQSSLEEDDTQHAVSTDVRFTINEEKLCEVGGRKAAQVDLLLLIPSTADEQNARRVIRNSYASESRNNTANVRHVFLFGVHKKEEQNRQIRRESQIHHDIILIDMVDSYDNLTRKVISGLTWSSSFCSNAKYIIKLDTDTWLNIRKLLTIIKANGLQLQNAVGGTPQHGARPIRDPKNKWYIPATEYPGDVYPDYCSGPAYIMPLKVARAIASVSRQVPFIRMEDVYMGMCVDVLGFRVKHVTGFCYWRATGDPCRLNDYVTNHRITPAEISAAWNSKCRG